MDDLKVERLLRQIPPGKFRVAKTAQMLTRALTCDGAPSKHSAKKKKSAEGAILCEAIFVFLGPHAAHRPQSLQILYAH